MTEHLAGWRGRVQLIVPLDLFNDRVNYKCETFEDVLRLNDCMRNILEKYSFLDPKRAQTELGKFKNNFEVLQTCLGEIEELLHIHVHPESKLEYYQSELDIINEKLASIYCNGDVGVANIWTSPCTSHAITNNGTTAAINSGQQGCVLSSTGISKGIKVWKLRMIQRTSTCMVGVAPENVNKSSSNYSTNGFYCNLDDGSLYSGPPTSYSNRAYISGGVRTGQLLTLTLNCDARTLSYNVDGRDYGVAYENLPQVKLFCAFDNNTTGGSTIELV